MLTGDVVPERQPPLLFGVGSLGPTPPGSHGDAGASETVGDGLCVDPELVGDAAQRQSARVELGCLGEDLVVPRRLFAVARDAVAVEVAGDGGSVDAELHGELADGGACSVDLKNVVDVGGGEASLGRV